MADKGNTYYCTWKRGADAAYVGWEIRRPKLLAKGETPRALMDALGDVVGEHYNDNEAALHFDPPLSEARNPAWFAEGLVEIAWNAGFRFRPTATTAYADGRCKRCSGGLGLRTTIPLEVDSLDDRTDGASSPQGNGPPPTSDMPGALMIVSEPFLAALSENERKTFEARPVKWKRTRRHQFFELMPFQFVPLGAVKGLEVEGWRCDACDRRVFGNGSVLGWGAEVACRQSLPKESADFFFAGNDKDVHLFCSRHRWKEMAGNKWARKLLGEPLVVVDQSEFEANPLLGTLDEIEAFREKHGYAVPFKPSPQS